MQGDNELHIPYETIARYLSGDSSDKVRVVVFDWLKKDVNNERLLKQMDILFNTSLLNERTTTLAFKALSKKIENTERI